jgi:hypothetical protein
MDWEDLDEQLAEVNGEKLRRTSDWAENKDCNTASMQQAKT